MEKQQLNDYLLNKQLRKEAMKEISGNFPLTEVLMREYRNELDWSEVSRNNSINWNASMIEFLERRIDWSVFSSFADEKILTPNLIERFKDRWDWKELSGNRDLHLSYELIDKYIDKWNWPSLMDNIGRRSLNSIGYRHNRTLKDDSISPKEFLARYHQYIPADGFDNSCLWDQLVEEEQNKIEQELIEKIEQNRCSL